jgi:hypothetical protein
MRTWQTLKQAFRSSTFVTLCVHGSWHHSTRRMRRIAGDHAYVADGSGGLQIINIKRPAAPRIVASVSALADARSVRVISDYAYVADFFDGIYAIDVSNPSRPRVAGSVDTPGEAQGVYQLDYDLLIVADGSGDLQLIDKRDPKSLRIVASYDIPGETLNVHGLASIVYVAGLDFRLGVFNVIDRSRLNSNGHLLVNSD